MHPKLSISYKILHPNVKDIKYAIPIKKCANQKTKYAKPKKSPNNDRCCFVARQFFQKLINFLRTFF